jgi:hypothetical protein
MSRTELPVLRLARLLADVARAGVLGAAMLSGLTALLLVRILALAHEYVPRVGFMPFKTVSEISRRYDKSRTQRKSPALRRGSFRLELMSGNREPS